MFSATAADESNEQSGVFCHTVASLLVPGYAQMDDADKEAAASQYQHVVRKCGHASEYALLGVLSALACWASFGQRATKGPMMPAVGSSGGLGKPAPCPTTARGYFKILLSGALAWLVCVLYATSDEIHQLFVPGRSCQIGDIAIDAAGAAAGIVLILLLISVKRRRSAKNSRGQ